MKIFTIVFVALISCVLTMPSQARAEQFVRFSDSQLFCAVRPEGNILSTIPVTGKRKDYAIKKVKTKLKRQRAKLKDAMAQLRAQLPSASRARRAKIQSSLAQGRFALDLIKETLDFAGRCAKRELDVLSTPLYPGGIGGGKK